jgi:hypothetical protein
VRPKSQYVVCKVESSPAFKRALISVIDAGSSRPEDGGSDMTVRFIPISIQTYKRLGLNVGERVTLKSSRIFRVST